VSTRCRTNPEEQTRETKSPGFQKTEVTGKAHKVGKSVGGGRRRKHYF
jgi:hypothetical protein